MTKYKIKQYFPAFCDFESNIESFDSNDELLNIPFVKKFRNENFYRFSISNNFLMAEYKNGFEWFVIGIILDSNDKKVNDYIYLQTGTKLPKFKAKYPYQYIMIDLNWMEEKMDIIYANWFRQNIQVKKINLIKLIDKILKMNFEFSKQHFIYSLIIVAKNELKYKGKTLEDHALFIFRYLNIIWKSKFPNGNDINDVVIDKPDRDYVKDCIKYYKGMSIEERLEHFYDMSIRNIKKAIFNFKRPLDTVSKYEDFISASIDACHYYYNVCDIISKCGEYLNDKNYDEYFYTTFKNFGIEKYDNTFIGIRTFFLKHAYQNLFDKTIKMNHETFN